MLQDTAWNGFHFSGRSDYLYKADSTGKLFPSNVRLPYGISNNYVGLVSMGEGDDEVAFLFSLNSGLTVNEPDTINIPQASPTDRNYNWLLLNITNWQFTGIEAPQGKTSDINAYYAQEKLFIRGKASRVEIFDISGKSIFVKTLNNSNQHQIPLQLKPGVYIYSITDKQQKTNGKFIAE